jgi:hypothetical protein
MTGQATNESDGSFLASLLKVGERSPRYLKLAPGPTVSRVAAIFLCAEVREFGDRPGAGRGGRSMRASVAHTR